VTTDPKRYVKNLEIEQEAGATGFQSFEGFQRALEATDEQRPTAYLNRQSLVSFTTHVTGQNRLDILNSILLAQLAANKKFPDDADVLKWYESYTDVLQNIGWVIQRRDFTHYSDSKSIFEMENVVIDIITAAIGGTAVAVLLKTLDAFKQLSDKDNKIVAFERNTHSLNKGSFQIGVATEKNDSVAIGLAAFVLSTTEEIKRILFFRSKKDKFKLQTSLMEGTMNQQAYSIVRNDIEKKLSHLVTTYVSEIAI